MNKITFGSVGPAPGKYEIEGSVTGEDADDLLIMAVEGKEDSFYILVNYVTGEMAAQHKEENRRYSISRFEHRITWDNGRRREFVSYE